MKIAFIGGGNMGGAILEGILKKGLYQASDITVSDPSDAVREKYAAMGVCAVEDNVQACRTSDLVVLAVKPHLYPTVLDGIKNDTAGTVFISIAAGKAVEQIKAIIGIDAKVVRAMPNTPALVGAGMTVLAQPDNAVTGDEFEAVKQLFAAVGEVEVLPESLLNSAIAVNGSSPAYIFMLIEAMGDAAVRDGIPRAAAYRLAAQSVLGSAMMVLQSGRHPGDLKDMVCSPGGTTIDAVQSLEQNGFRAAVMDAMQACTKKAQQM